MSESKQTTRTFTTTSKDVDLYNEIMKQSGLFKNGVQIAEELNVNVDKVRAITNTIKWVVNNDWSSLIDAQRHTNYTGSMLVWAQNYTKIEIPDEVFAAKCAALDEAAESQRKRTEGKNKEKSQEKIGLSIWEQKMLENSNQMVELMTQMMDVVLPKYTVEVLIAIKDAVKEIIEKSGTELETIQDIQKKVDAIDANWYTTKDLLGAIKENTGKWRNRT